MNKKILLYFIVAFCAGTSSVLAGVEPSYTPHEPRAVTAWYGKAGEKEQRADMDFIAGMRPHHAGALTMSEEYLNNPQASSSVLKQLARGIIHNQKFEIDMLDTVKENLSHADNAKSMEQIATNGLAQKERFIRAPMPGPLDAWAGTKEVSAEDVRFAKAMIMHHRLALDMAHEYLDNPDAKNGYLGRMCLDILLDQEQEIVFMQSVIEKYPSDPDTVKIDSSMVHGMEGMNHAKAKVSTDAKNHAAQGHH